MSRPWQVRERGPMACQVSSTACVISPPLTGTSMVKGATSPHFTDEEVGAQGVTEQPLFGR